MSKKYINGKKTTELKKTKSTKETGTEITFLPSKDIFTSTNFDIEIIHKRVKSYLS